MRLPLAALALLATSCATTQHPPAGTDADTVAWWGITGDLSSDAMEGRDTGSAGYDRAAKYVAERFAKAGLQPAGENSTWFQTLPLQELRVEKEGTSFELVSNLHGVGDRVLSATTTTTLEFLRDITVRPIRSLPSQLDASLAFRG